MISILIAVYNAAEWLPQCLDSLLAQRYTDWEAVCVDDASTDASWSVLQRYADTDERFRIVHLSQNAGQAHARNVGLREAKGEWVTMLDADDWFSPDTLALAMAKVNDGIDCVMLRCRLVYPDGREDELTLNRAEWTPEQAAIDAVAWQGIHGLYVLRTDIHRQYPYDEATMLYSDDNTSRIHLLHSRRIVASDGVYYYRQHSASTTHTVSIRHFDHILALDSLQSTLRSDSAATPALCQAVTNQRWYVLTDLWHYYFMNYKRLKDEKKIIEQILRLSYRTLISERVTSPIRHRFGYWRLRPYWLYVAHVKCYFSLRRLFGKENS